MNAPLRQPSGHRAGVGRRSGVSALLSTQRKAMASPTPFRPPWGLASRRATSSGVSTCSAPAPSRAHTRSGRWQTAPTACPTASMPATAATASAQGGITGSYSAGALRGRRLAPSASTSTTSAARRSSSGVPAPESLSPRKTVPTVTTPCPSRAARRRSGVGSSTRGRPGWRRMWVVVVTTTVRPLSAACRARAYRVEVLPPAPTRATIRWRAMSRPNCSQMPMLSPPTGAR